MTKETSCAKPTGMVLGHSGQKPENDREPASEFTKESKMTARVGEKAPDFQAPSYYKGEFSSVKLSDYLGQWILVCFYPGDFTYV